MFKDIANLASLVRHAQQVSGRVQEINDQLKTQRVIGEAGAGMVSVEANGLGEIRQVKIDPDLVARGEREMIEDLLPAAINQAVAKARELQMEMMQSATQEMNVPGLREALAKITEQGFGDDTGK
jgi:DNA-binding YbaB/EbfC family protein